MTQTTHRLITEVEPDLLGFGIGVFQAVMTGGMPVPLANADDNLTHAGMLTLVNEVAGHGLSDEAQVSLVLRVLAFADLLDRAGQDARLSHHVKPHDGGVLITEQFLAAAARAGMRSTDDGDVQYDLESVARQLLH